jgi:hypothetical protein
MRARFKVLLVVTTLALLLSAVLFLPVFPWSARCRHSLSKAWVKSEIRLARWRGHEPRLAAITGSVSVAGASVEALDSVSGWATIADSEGRFTLPDVMWYPGAAFDLVVSTDSDKHVRIRVTAPDHLSESNTFDAGKLDVEKGEPIDPAATPGINSITWRDYDRANFSYYKNVFDRLTAGRESDHDRLEAITRHISAMLNYEETTREQTTPRDTLERGSGFCGSLALAFATVAEAGGYRTRTVDIIDNLVDRNTHVLAEVYYDHGWHLYDPTYGVVFKNEEGKAASYREIRLDASLVREDLFHSLDPRVMRWLLGWLPKAYGSGFHHYYRFR